MKNNQIDERFDKNLAPIYLAHLKDEPGWIMTSKTKVEVKAFLHAELDQLEAKNKELLAAIQVDISQARKEERRKTLELFREYKEKYRDANWNDAIGLLIGNLEEE